MRPAGRSPARRGHQREGASPLSAEHAKTAVALLSVVSNTTLVAAKLVVGLLIGSVSVLSEAVHSGVDLVASIVALAAVRYSGKPADEDHPFGHGKAENLAGAFEAILIVGAGIWIIIEAARKLAHPEPVEALGWGVAVMAVSTVANTLVSTALFRVGKRTESPALLADGWHLRTDVYTSLGVLLGLGAIELGRRVAPQWNLAIVDPLVAIAVALLILRAGWKLTHDSSRDLVDGKLSREEEGAIRESILAFRPTVRGFHRLRTRKAGAHRFVDFHLTVRADMPVAQAHQLTDDLSDEIERRLGRISITIHVEPCGDGCPDSCRPGCLLGEEERARLAGNPPEPAE